jgi:hypothetical protein
LKILTFQVGLKNRNFNFFLNRPERKRKFENFPPTLPQKVKNFNFSLCASKLKILTFHSFLKNRNFNVFNCPLKIVISSFSSNLNRKSKISSVHSCLKNRKFTFYLDAYKSKISTFYLINLKLENFNFWRWFKNWKF